MANNPISFIDPDGRLIDPIYGSDGKITGWEFTGSDINLVTGYFGSGGDFGNLTTQLDDYGSNFGSGPLSNFWNCFDAGSLESIAVNNGYMSWASSFGEIFIGEDYIQLEGLALNSKKIDQGGFDSFMDDYMGEDSSYYGWSGFNGVLGSASAFTTYRAGALKYNELWHKTKTRGYSFAWQKRWKNTGAKSWRVKQTQGFQSAKNFGKKLTRVGGVAIAADIAMSGEIKPSHVINGLMLGISGTGVGSIIAGAWFIADYGTMGVNYLMGNGATGLGDMIDSAVAENYGKLEIYDGLY